MTASNSHFPEVKRSNLEKNDFTLPHDMKGTLNTVLTLLSSLAQINLEQDLTKSA
jgi:hypothetical protein